VPATLSEIAETAKRLRADLARDRLLSGSGREARSASRQLRVNARLLFGDDALPVIQREMASASGGQLRDLQALLRWVSRERVEAELGPVDDQLAAWETGAFVRGGNQPIPLRRARAIIARTEDRETRRAIFSARNRVLEESGALRLDLAHREREAVGQLAMGSYEEGLERLEGFDLTWLESEARRLMNATDDAYRDALLTEAGERLGDDGPLDRSDAIWLTSMAGLAQPFAPTPLLATARRFLKQLSMPLPRGSAVSFDFDRRKLKARRSFVSVIHAPGEAAVVLARLGGWADARGLMNGIGAALHASHTPGGLSWIVRELGDRSVREALAMLFEFLLLDSEWVARATGLDGVELHNTMRAAGFAELYRLRRLAGLFIWEMESARVGAPGSTAGRFADLLTTATGFVHHPVSHLENQRGRLRGGSESAVQLRGWMLGAVLRNALEQRFGTAWYVDPSAGEFLREVISTGGRDNADTLAAQFGMGRLRAGPLINFATGWYREGHRVPWRP